MILQWREQPLVCVCVERETERKGGMQRERERERKGESEGEREGDIMEEKGTGVLISWWYPVCVCVCGCVCVCVRVSVCSAYLISLILDSKLVSLSSTQVRA